MTRNTNAKQEHKCIEFQIPKQHTILAHVLRQATQKFLWIENREPKPIPTN